MRGAHCTGATHSVKLTGPSPRAWGSLKTPKCLSSEVRSIPTCVGLTRCGACGSARRRVHPHVRGAHDLSPFAVFLTQVHPHVRGAHCVPAQSRRCHRGPSPRAWGSLEHGQGDAVGPLVHPHVRGAHVHAISLPKVRDGPSPRAWGSRTAQVSGHRLGRSIPTCVGLTSEISSTTAAAPVHPHVRGAHGPGVFVVESAIGPSPRAWGSQLMTCDNAERYLCVIFGLGPRAVRDPTFNSAMVPQASPEKGLVWGRPGKRRRPEPARVRQGLAQALGGTAWGKPNSWSALRKRSAAASRTP